MGKLSRLALPFAICLFFTGCSAYRVTMPRVSGAALTKEQKAIFFAELTKKEAEIRSAKLLFNTQIIEAGDQTTVKQAILFEKPQKLRIETFPLNQSIALSLFVTDGSDATFIDHNSGERYDDITPTDILRSFLHLPIDHKDFISLLTASVPDRFLNDNLVVIEDNKSQKKLLIVQDSDSWLLLDSTTNRLLEAALNEQFQKSTALYLKYEWDSGAFPVTIQLVAKKDFSIKLKTRSAQTNVAISDSNWAKN